MTRWTSFQRVYLHVEKHMGRNVDERMLIKRKEKEMNGFTRKKESHFSCKAIDRITTFCVKDD